MLNKERLENLTNEVWKGAIKLRGKFKAKDYPSVILPMIMIRRIECVLEEKRAEFRDEIISKDKSFSDDSIAELHKKDAEKAKLKRAELQKKIKQHEVHKLDFFNKSNWTMKGILAESSTQVETNFRDFINNFSSNVDEIIDKFEYRQTITKVVKEKRLTEIIQLVAEEDFSPKRLSNIEMGYVYETLLQKFSQDDAKDTGEHFTPREIIRVMVDLMEIDFDPEKSTKAISLFDPACGTGGMLSIAKEHLIDMCKTEKAKKNVEDLVLLNGQEFLSQNYAVCKADMLIKGEVRSNITHGNSLIPHLESIEDDGDQHAGKKFDYMISNPPFGVDWSPYKNHVLKLESSRYKVGTPPSNDGALLFLLSMIEKMKSPKEGGSKIAILFNGSPLLNGDATQGESEIRRYILENDLLDTIVMIPDQMFYNTSIYTYIWLLNNNKEKDKKDHVLVINARNQFEKETKSFGQKRNKINKKNRDWIHSKYSSWQESNDVKKFHIKDFAFHKVNVVSWKENVQGEKLWISEPFSVQLNNSNINKAFKLYGDFTIDISINDEHNVKFKFDGKKAFETKLAEEIKKMSNKFEGTSLGELKKWFKMQKNEATYYHRYFIIDNEYIPYDRNIKDKIKYIQDFLEREIKFDIISWEEYSELGYELWLHKKFYRFIEPQKSEEILNDFWTLEEKSNSILESIK